jgi:hypothetical protein
VKCTIPIAVSCPRLVAVEPAQPCLLPFAPARPLARAVPCPAVPAALSLSTPRTATAPAPHHLSAPPAPLPPSRATQDRQRHLPATSPRTSFGLGTSAKTAYPMRNALPKPWGTNQGARGRFSDRSWQGSATQATVLTFARTMDEAAWVWVWPVIGLRTHAFFLSASLGARLASCTSGLRTGTR